MMVSIFQNPSHFSEFEDWAPQNDSFGPSNLKVEALDYSKDSRQPQTKMISVLDLAKYPLPPLRIIFAPLDLPTEANTPGFLWLFKHYSLPTAFLSERLQAVANSFGALNDIDGYNCSWFHYLCKNITLHRHHADGPSWISDPRPDVPQMRQADWTWIRSGYFLRWTADLNSNVVEVTLICFEASSSLKHRFRNLQLPASCKNAIDDPWSLFVVVLDELFLQMSETVWDVSEAFGEIETVR